jgi:uncharacterized protein (UPF0303 family)
LNKYQDHTTKDLESEENSLAFSTFTHEDALHLGQFAISVIKDRPIAMEVRKGNHLIFKASMPGTSQDNDWWLNRKFRAADRFGHSSLWVKKKFIEMGQDFEIDSGLDQDLYAAHGGVVPIIVKGVGMVGGIGISGLPDWEDHTYAVEVLNQFLKQ